MLQKLFNLVFPTACIVCETQGPDLCKKCIDSFHEYKPQNYEWIISLWDYHDPQVEKLMRYIKNYPNARVAKIIVSYLPLTKGECPALRGEGVIIPIPIGRDRFIQRGYNQAELLAQSIAQKLKVPMTTRVLFKKRKTRKQGTTHSKQEREQNIKNSFGIKNPHLIKDKDVLLVDDITTTGSTLAEAQNVLLQAGARTVRAITVAN